MSLHSETLAVAIMDEARRHPERVALRDASDSWTYADLRAVSAGVATALRGLGLRDQDAVAVVGGRSTRTVLGLVGVLHAGGAYCVLDPALPAARRQLLWEDLAPKAVLLTAVARAAGIPSRLGFCDVRNHLQTYALRQRMGGTDLFVYHGYSELLLDGRWVKATPAFNRELCARFGVEPIDFDGRSDALLHQHSADGAQHMDYVRDRGWFADLPLPEILAALRSHYGDLVGAKAPTDEFQAPGSPQPSGSRRP